MSQTIHIEHRDYASVDSRTQMYEGICHEILNESGRQVVFEDILNWIRLAAGLKVTCHG